MASVVDAERVHDRVGESRIRRKGCEELFWAEGFEILRSMQDRHFWYRGRHRFLLWAFQRRVHEHAMCPKDLRLIDIGGGCGGWISYLLRSLSSRPAEIALGDSSPTALRFAGEVLPGNVQRYHVDLLDLRLQVIERDSGAA